MQATIVFQQIWDAMNRQAENGRFWRYIILEGSSRSSKTRSLLQAYYLYAQSHTKKRLSVWRDTAKDCRDTVGYDMGVVYPELENYFQTVTFNKTLSIYRFNITKTNIEVCGTDDSVKVHGYQGDVIWLNEPYKISKDTFDQLDQRTADFVFIDWNPKQAHWIEDLKKDPRTLVIHSTFKDNPFCPSEQRIKILSYQSVKYSHIGLTLGEHEAKKLDITSSIFTSKQIEELVRCKENEIKNSANDFNWCVYGLGIKAEKPNRIFKWTEIPDEEYNQITAKVYYGIDWGKSDPWGIVECKYYDGCLYLKEINYLSENKIRERLTIPELNQIDSSEEGLVSWYFNKFGISKSEQLICDTNRPLKIMALRKLGYSYAVPAMSKAILDGIDILVDLKVYFTASSTNLKYEQENYSRKVDRYGIVLEEPEDLDNHLIDPSRYIALHLKRLGIIKNI